MVLSNGIIRQLPNKKKNRTLTFQTCSRAQREKHTKGKDVNDPISSRDRCCWLYLQNVRVELPNNSDYQFTHTYNESSWQTHGITYNTNSYTGVTFNALLFFWRCAFHLISHLVIVCNFRSSQTRARDFDRVNSCRDKRKKDFKIDRGKIIFLNHLFFRPRNDINHKKISIFCGFLWLILKSTNFLVVICAWRKEKKLKNATNDEKDGRA